jgi:hypothetical protein
MKSQLTILPSALDTIYAHFICIASRFIARSGDRLDAVRRTAAVVVDIAGHSAAWVGRAAHSHTKYEGSAVIVQQ